MALGKDALSELLDALRAGGDLDLVRSGLQLVLQALIELEATQQIGAEPVPAQPRADDPPQRGPRAHALDQGRRLGAADPQAAAGRLLPLAARAAPAHRPGPVGGRHGGLTRTGVSTRKVDDLVRAVGIDAGVSKSEVSRICAELDEHACLSRSPPGPQPVRWSALAPKSPASRGGASVPAPLGP